MTAQATPAISDQLRIVFDGPPGPTAGRFVEVETADGKSINAGDWRERPDGLWELVLRASTPTALDRLQSVDGLEELSRASNALLNNLWQDVWSGKRSHEENWKEFDRKFPGVKWLHDARNLLSTTPQASATAHEPERRASEDKGGDAIPAHFLPKVHYLADFNLPDVVLPLGLYCIYWKSGGSSEAAVGMGSNGTRWLAPTNWITPDLTGRAPAWEDIERAELIATPRSPDKAQEALTAIEEVIALSDRKTDAWDRAKSAVATLRALTTPPVDPAGVTAMREPVACRHEPFEGRCIHCNAPFKNGIAAPVATPPADLEKMREALLKIIAIKGWRHAEHREIARNALLDKPGVRSNG